jgi:hypothetical protein
MRSLEQRRQQGPARFAGAELRRRQGNGSLGTKTEDVRQGAYAFTQQTEAGADG